MSDLRRHPRKPVSVPLVLTAPHHGSVEGATRDLSVGGAFALVPVRLPFATEVTLKLSLPSGALQLPGIVRWDNPEGVGIQFGLLGARETHALTTFLAEPA